MLSRFFALMGNVLRAKAGNATMLVAIGMPALIGGAGFAVDTAQYYLWKQELQHAVDQAAIAGAWTLAKDRTSEAYSDRAVQEFNANLQVIGDFASAPTVELADYAGDDDNSVIVTATVQRELPFSGFLIGKPLFFRASAQASFTAGKAYTACLKSTKDSGTGFEVGGNATVKAKCGLAALSCSDNAIVIDGSATVQTDSIVTCGTATVPAANESVVSEKVTGLSDPYADLTAPSNPTAKSYSCQTVSKGKNKVTQAALEPGTYSSIVVSCTTTFAEGIYVIDGGTLDLAANYNVTGTHVMFVLKNGALLKLGGQGQTSNVITLSPMEAADFAGTPQAAQANKYAGILIFEDRNSQPRSPYHKINGNSDSLIEGVIYLPKGEVTVGGNAYVSSQCLLISAYKITIQGGAMLETLCPTAQSMNIGTMAGTVRLVA